MNTTKPSTRNSVMECLRILCMLMIIAGHYYAHGIEAVIAPLTPENYTLKILALQLISFGADIANDLFILIMGYYMINSVMKGKRIVKLFFKAVIYAAAIALIFHFSGLRVLSVKEFKEFLLPFGQGENWFITCYLLLCLLVPYMNPFLKNLEQKQFAKLLLLIFAIHFIAPLQERITFWSVERGLEQFIFLYFTGAYIRLHGFQTKLLQRNLFWWGILILLAILWFSSSTYIGIQGLTHLNQKYISNVTKYFPLFSVLIAAVLVVISTKIKPFYSRFINLISGSVLGIYLIHDNWLVREFIWRSASPNTLHLTSNYIFIHMVKKVIVIFIVCVLIDQCFLWLFEKPLEKLFSKPSE